MAKMRVRPAIHSLGASCLALSLACTHEPAAPAADETAADDGDSVGSDAASGLAAADDPQAYGGCAPFVPLDPFKLELIPFDLIPDIFAQRLPQPNELGEDLVIHVRPSVAGDPEPQPNLVAVFGTPEAPVIGFDSEALAQLGAIPKSPGKGFFTLFTKLDAAGVERRAALDKQIDELGDVAEFGLVFAGRHVVGRAETAAFAASSFLDGELVRFGGVRVTPASDEKNWRESVFITDKEVVQDPTRTIDTCTGEGEACGPWTFCHLMTEMANTSRTGITPEEFTQKWLEQWLDGYAVNDDFVDARADMKSKIIDPWLAASGGGSLDLGKAPFRLLAIVNRLDLRRTTTGGGGYFGGGGLVPADAGELRFVFGVMAPDGSGKACEPLPFTVIFEYGVPREGCFSVVDWANQWVALDLMGGYGSAYRDALAALTESVVVRDADPGAGNGSAINQIRTNENALHPTWEMREFTLNDQSFTCESAIDTPSDGYLRPHTVAQTPDDAVHAPTTNALVDSFVNNRVIPVTTASPCESGHVVPPSYDCADKPDAFLGGNALVEQNVGGSPPGAWKANSSAGASAQFICGRHQFSLNTCNGCHACDTATTFTHVDPTGGIPAALSGFLLGATVDDTQFSGTSWHFADLQRRYQDLYSVAGAQCLQFNPVFPDFFEKIDFDPFGPVVDIERMKEIFEARLVLSSPEAIGPLTEDIGRIGIRSH